jgi:hypothetical protein
MKLKSPLLRGILSVLAVIVGSTILLNLTFLLDAVYQMPIRRLAALFLPLGPDSELSGFPFLMHGSFAVLMLIASWFILKSKLRTLFKAIYLPVPLAVVYVTFGIFLYQWLLAEYAICSLFGFGVIFYLYKTRQPWLYYASFAFITLALLAMAITGTEL